MTSALHMYESLKTAAKVVRGLDDAVRNLEVRFQRATALPETEIPTPPAAP